MIENDHASYGLRDCLYVFKKIGIPVVFDVFHHECLNNGEKIRSAIIRAKKTWKKKDGKIMIDYSSQKQGALKGGHTESIEIKKFRNFLKEIKGIDCDIMLEIKNKERSALRAISLIK